MSRSLEVPADFEQSDDGVEVFRGWVIGGALQCVLNPTVWQDHPENWGILLADAAHHVSNALAESGLGEASEIKARVVAALIAELAEPTDTHSGEYTG